MLTSKQRAKLAALASTLKPVVFLGKGGAAEGVAAALNKALDDHELVKLRFIDFKGERRQLAEELAQKCQADLIRVIGNVAVLFRRSRDPEKQQIKLD
ncbi:MAG: YhbY family RNA-binding protein [Spirochaetes bacterium]|nr:YhbY family RNA-binding protein [Spirochaetota bacterium]MBU0956576.1 YhbY family RNA-binding protein [Spirochaetota bacterium]